MLSLKSQAIQTALVGDWTTAISLNKLILEETPDDIDTLNRLAFAHMSSGNANAAKELYEKVLKLDKQNPIAIRNLKRLGEKNNKRTPVLINNLFIEEPGKTKVIDLINTAEKNVISHLRSGEKLSLRIKRSKIFVLDLEGKFLGMLPDDICQRLMKFLDAGNEYEAYVRTVDNIKISVFIRETKRVKKFTNQPSFLLSNEKTKIQLTSRKRN